MTIVPLALSPVTGELLRALPPQRSIIEPLVIHAVDVFFAFSKRRPV